MFLQLLWYPVVPEMFHVRGRSLGACLKICLCFICFHDVRQCLWHFGDSDHILYTSQKRLVVVWLSLHTLLILRGEEVEREEEGDGEGEAVVHALLRSTYD